MSEESQHAQHTTPSPTGEGWGEGSRLFLSEWQNSSDRLLVHTSGSTGKPKAMWVEKERMLNSARMTCDALDLKPGDTALLCMPLDFIAGKMMVVRSIERQLRLISVTPSNHPLATLAMPADGITFAAMVPSQVFCTLQVPAEREKLRHIRHLIIGGGAISAELQQELDTFYAECNPNAKHSSECNPNAKDSSGDRLAATPRGGLGRGFFFSTYGMTETLSHIALRTLTGPEATEWYTPFAGITLSLSADNCLIIDAPQLHDGPLITNDIAELRSDGRFRIIGRKDNVICSGGIKLHIEEIEAKLQPHIRQPFCITKRSDEKFGEVAVMLIEDNELEGCGVPDNIPGKECPLTSPDWSAFGLSRYEFPKAIIPVCSIPMTATGKIDRHTAQTLATTYTI